VSVVPVRAVVGPLIVASAVWCAAGVVGVAGVDAADVRLVVPAPWWTFLVGLVAAFAVAPWRRSPMLAAPALLTILPWLPVPLPAAALIWTSGAAWIPVVLAVVAAVVRPFVSSGPDQPEPAATPWRSAVAAGVLSLMASGAVLWSVHPLLPGGDEPHYLIIAQSLLRDGDLRIENNHTNRDHASYWPGSLGPHFIQRGTDGEIYSIHAPGVPVLVAPLFAAFGLRGAQMTLMLLGAVAGACLWLAGWFTTRQAGAAWFAWAAIGGAVTMLVQSVTVFPDGPAAAGVAFATVVWLRLRRHEPVSRVWLVATSATLAILPFLHTRFVVLAAGLGVAFAFELWRGAGAGAGVNRVQGVATFMAVPLCGAVAWFAYFFFIYGSLDPLTPYGVQRESSVWYIPGAIVGLLFDQQFGVLPYAPVLAMAALGWRGRSGTGEGGLLPLGLIAGAYLAAVGSYWMWWAGGPAPPARLATSVLPMLAPPLAAAWAAGGVWRRALMAVLLVATLATSVYVLGTHGGELAWSVRDGRAAWLVALGSVADLPRAWPSFFWRVIGGDVRSEWPFVLHVLIWVAVFGTPLVACGRLLRGRRATVDTQIGAAACLVPVALMMAVQSGWWVSNVRPVDPAVAQLSVLRASSTGAGMWRVVPFGLAKIEGARSRVTITIPRTDLPNDQRRAWADLADVPAGQYELRLTCARPAAGTLSVYVAPLGGDPLKSVTLPRQSLHTVGLTVPSNVGALRVVLDDSLAGGVERIDLVPVRLATEPQAPR
jgi:hypothetical protein